MRVQYTLSLAKFFFYVLFFFNCEMYVFGFLYRIFFLRYQFKQFPDKYLHVDISNSELAYCFFSSLQLAIVFSKFKFISLKWKGISSYSHD